MKKVRELKSWIEGYEQVTSAVGDLQVLFDFAKEGEATEEEVDANTKRPFGCWKTSRCATCCAGKKITSGPS